MKVKYSANNSGGSWWLSDANWIALEEAGWDVVWGGLYFCHSSFSFHERPANKPILCDNKEECPGHRKCDSAKDVDKTGNRRLGALANDASKEFTTIKDALIEFEEVTGQSITEEGCNCCGPPHSFSWNDDDSEWNYCSGEMCMNFLFKDSPVNFREAVEKLQRDKLAP